MEYTVGSIAKDLLMIEPYRKMKIPPRKNEANDNTALKLLDEASARFTEDERRLEHDRFLLRRGIKNPSHCQTDTCRGHLFNGQLDR